MGDAFRLVETGHDAAGRAVFRADGTPAHSVAMEGGVGVAEHLWLDRPPATADDGVDRAGAGFDLEPPPGGASVRIIRLPPPPAAAADEGWLRVEGDDPARPGMHTTDTLDCIVVLDGDIVLGLDGGEHALSKGDCAIQRGNCTPVARGGRSALHLRGDHAAPGGCGRERGDRGLAAPVDHPATDGWRRLVTGTDAGGRSFVVAEGAPPSGLRATGTTLAELWQTGGPLATPTQGGDPEGAWDLEPRGGGVAFRSVQMPAGTDPGEGGWHTTDTIDIDILVSGQVELHLPDLAPVLLGPGDSVLQRGTHHKWVPAGDEPVHWIAVMFALRH